MCIIYSNFGIGNDRSVCGLTGKKIELYVTKKLGRNNDCTIDYYYCSCRGYVPLHVHVMLLPV